MYAHCIAILYIAMTRSRYVLYQSGMNFASLSLMRGDRKQHFSIPMDL